MNAAIRRVPHLADPDCRRCFGSGLRCPPSGPILVYCDCVGEPPDDPVIVPDHPHREPDMAETDFVRAVASILDDQTLVGSNQFTQWCAERRNVLTPYEAAEAWEGY